jgi:exodeoxyribonuclease-3
VVADELKSHTRLAVLGDFNIAPADEDVHDPKAWEARCCDSPRSAKPSKTSPWD